MTVRDIDHGAKDLLRRVKSPVTIRVGVIGEEASESHQGGDDTVADIATKHELGIGVPERSFIRDWADESERDNRKLLRRIPRAITRGTSVRQAAEQVGHAMVGSIQQRISAGIDPPLAKKTIERKGSSTPLINTGQLRSSITHVIELAKGIARGRR